MTSAPQRPDESDQLRFRVRWAGRVEEGVTLKDIRLRVNDGIISLAHEVETDQGWITVDDLLAAYRTQDSDEVARRERERLHQAEQAKKVQDEQKGLIEDYQRSLESERKRRQELEGGLDETPVDSSHQSTPTLRKGPKLPPPPDAQAPAFHNPHPFVIPQSKQGLPPPAPETYVILNGVQSGPYALPAIRQMLVSGAINTSTLAWRDGAADWKPVSEILPGVAKDVPPRAPAQKGIGRLAYVLISVGIILLATVVMMALEIEEGTDGFLVLQFLTAIVLLLPMISRMLNIGRSGAFALLALIPLVTIVISFMCLCLPPGYHQTKKLDQAGKILVGIIISIIILTVIGVIINSS